METYNPEEILANHMHIRREYRNEPVVQEFLSLCARVEALRDALDKSPTFPQLEGYMFDPEPSVIDDVHGLWPPLYERYGSAHYLLLVTFEILTEGLRHPEHKVRNEYILTRLNGALNMHGFRVEYGDIPPSFQQTPE